MTHKIAYILLFCLTCGMTLYGQQTVTDSLLTVLDRTIAEAAQYEQKKQQRIEQLKQYASAGKPVSVDEEYALNCRLYDEYETYICDSARHYINRNIELAQRSNRTDWLNASKLKKADILAKTGLYAEGMALLRSIESGSLPKELLVEYYTTFENLYLFYAEYVTDSEFQEQYLNLLYVYRDSVLQVTEPGSYSYVMDYAPQLLMEDKGEEAIRLLESYLDKLPVDTRQYAVATSIMAFVYQCCGMREKQKEYLTRSAIADIRDAVKENTSLRVLAELLYEEGQLKRADYYLKQSMENANFYNTRLRHVQAARILPMIDSAYLQQKEKNSKVQQLFLIITTLLVLFLLVAVGYVIRQNRKLARIRKELVDMNGKLKTLNEQLVDMNRKQSRTNSLLTEANHIKEEYVGSFISLCSSYIDKLKDYRSGLNKLAASGRMEELFKTLKSSRFVDDQLKELYSNFDNAFLNIFPDFVVQFNRLMPAEEQIVPKRDGQLTTELRIFALIRLGITDSARIAAFLRNSITTIYTYRSKMKNRSLCRENFEEEIQRIGAFDC